jgi:hypothetical protein
MIYIKHDFGPIFVIQTFMQKPLQHTAQYVMKFEIHPPLTSPADISTDFYALQQTREARTLARPEGFAWSLVASFLGPLFVFVWPRLFRGRGNNQEISPLLQDVRNYDMELFPGF